MVLAPGMVVVVVFRDVTGTEEAATNWAATAEAGTKVTAVVAVASLSLPADEDESTYNNKLNCFE